MPTRVHTSQVLALKEFILLETQWAVDQYMPQLVLNAVMHAIVQVRGRQTHRSMHIDADICRHGRMYTCTHIYPLSLPLSPTYVLSP